jgi:hypothetical protein
VSNLGDTIIGWLGALGSAAIMVEYLVRVAL